MNKLSDCGHMYIVNEREREGRLSSQKVLTVFHTDLRGCVP